MTVEPSETAASLPAAPSSAAADDSALMAPTGFSARTPESLLRHQPFVLYWNARIFAAIAFQMMGVAVGWQMYALTGDAFDLGLVGLAQFLPALLLMMIAGQLADRYNRRLILQLCQIAEGGSAAALAIGSFSGSLSKDFILVAVFLLGVGRSFEAPTMQTLLPAIVPAALFPRAVAGSSTAQQVATISGPALGGFLYLFSPTMVYSVCCAMFLAAAVQLAFVKIGRVASVRPPLTLGAFFAGLSFIRHSPIVLGVMSLDLFAVLLGGATALLPIFAKDVFDVGPVGVGLLRAAPAVGALTTMAVLTHWAFTRGVGKIMFGAVAAFGAATIVFALSQSFALSMVALIILGASDAASVVIRQTLVQIETPDEMRGRVSAVNSLFVGMSNQLGDFRAGMVAAWIGAMHAVLFGGIGTLLVVVVGTRVFSELYRTESFHRVRD
jgi:MFS family permease